MTNDPLYDNAPHPADPSLRIGSVYEMGIPNIRVECHGDEQASSYEPCMVGEYVVIPTAGIASFGQVRELRLEEIAAGYRGPIASIALLCSIDLDTGIIWPGLTNPPPLGHPVFRAHSSIVRMVAESRPGAAGGHADVGLDLAHLSDRDRTPFSVRPEVLFGRHLAILGTTGSGKSYTVSRLIEETARHRSKVILLDPSGEFSTLRDSALHVYIGQHPRPFEHQHQVVVPYYQLIENDLFWIFRPTGESQAPKLRQAIKSLKLARLAPEISLGGEIIKASKTKQYYQKAYLKHVHEIEGPEANFDITRLVKQINNECVFLNRSAMETNVWGDVNTLELSHCVPLVNRVHDITTSASLAPIFKPGTTPSIFEVLDRFLADEEHRVLVISLQYLSFEHNAREIVANAIGRHLLKLARDERFAEMPILVCVDEAHQFLNEKDELSQEYAMDSFALIAKEGRKYGLHICIATQRPRDVPENVLSQMGTLIVHRLINDADRSIIERASAEANSAALTTLPILMQGQAVLMGADFPAPLLVQINFPLQPPAARSADFQKHWVRTAANPA